MTLQINDEKDLLELLSQGNEMAFSALYVRYKDKLSAFCYTLLKSTDEVRDVVQEIFMQVWVSHQFINPNASFSSYLHTIAHHRIMNHFRHSNVEERVKKIIMENSIRGIEMTESSIIYQEYVDLLKDAVDLLPAQRKKIFRMSRENNMSYREIAEELGISVSTVQEHISLALQSIRKHFSKHTDLEFIIFLWIVFYGK